MKEEPAAVLRGMELKASYKPVAILCEFFLFFSLCKNKCISLFSVPTFCILYNVLHCEDKQYEVIKNLKYGVTVFH